MAYYRFHLDVNVPPAVVAERLRAIAGGKLSVFDSTSFAHPDPSGPPFRGTVTGSRFKLRRNISGRNSFLPMIRGRLRATSTGTRISVTMFLQPFTAIFMVVWLTVTGGLNSGPFDPVLGLLFLFGIGLVVFGFFPEAIKARRLIIDAATRGTPATASPQAIGRPPGLIHLKRAYPGLTAHSAPRAARGRSGQALGYHSDAPLRALSSSFA
jgi:hypothetical protein